MNPITFSTLACPRWHIGQIIANASAFGYEGIEWRGGPEGHLRPNTSATARAQLRQQCADAGLISLAVTSYTSFVSDSAEERQANVDDLRRYVDLAAEIGAGYVRAFLGELHPGAKLDSSLYEKIVDCLTTASEYADSAGVRIAVEPHDDFVRSSAVVPILNRISHPALRVIWDIGNTWAASEEPEEAFELLKDRLAYIHVKDGKRLESGWQLCSFGEGTVPLGRAFELLSGHGYEGAISVEWEYAWHPELDPPELALPAARQFVQELLAASQTEST